MWAFQPLPAVVSGGGLSGPTGLSTEADTALATGRKKSKAVGPAVETGASLALAAVKRRASGLATETDSAVALIGRKSKPAGVAAESDSALALSRSKSKTAGVAAETAAAFAIARIKQRAAGASAEADTAFALARIKSRAAGQSIETDDALALVVGGGPPSPANVVDPGTRGGRALRDRLIREYEDEQARKKALDELPRIPDRQRKAVHRAAKQLASRPVLTEEIVERDIAAELSTLKVEPTSIHLEWALHYLRVLAHRQRLAEQAERDDEEALMLLI